MIPLHNLKINAKAHFWTTHKLCEVLHGSLSDNEIRSSQREIEKSELFPAYLKLNEIADHLGRKAKKLF
ncbi:MAG: hypothetical protein C0582_04720 [Alphaproteobacteria bacterium]|nr:MAG: hypothetical protein C0582_04720 [Alphaproteobacteria bacterium]